MRNKFDYNSKWWHLPNIKTTMNKDINPKMLLTKEELRMNVIGQNGNDGLHYEGVDYGDIEMMIEKQFTGVENAHKIVKAKIDYEKTKTPNYYVGEVFGYEARNIIEDFDLSYNLGTCISYLLRAKRKHDSQIECIAKAINHLEFELERLKR